MRQFQFEKNTFISLLAMFFCLGLIGCAEIRPTQFVKGASNDPAANPLSDAETETELSEDLVADPDLISAHYPLGGALAGGDQLVIYGDGFLTQFKVFIGGVECTTASIEPIQGDEIDELYAGAASERITCTVPAGANLGSADVVVVQSDKTFGASPDNFLYESDQISSVVDLAKLDRNWHREYSLMNNLDLAGVVITPLKYFFGKINGGGFSIDNLQLTFSNTGVTGLITELHGELNNINFLNPTITHTFDNTNAGDQHSMGLVAGVLKSTGVINAVNVTNPTVNFNDPNVSFVGSLPPVIEMGGQIANSLVTGGVYSVVTNDMTPFCAFGGNSVDETTFPVGNLTGRDVDASGFMIGNFDLSGISNLNLTYSCNIAVTNLVF